MQRVPYFGSNPICVSPVEIRESPGTDLTVPCAVPSYMNKPSLKWTFSNGEDLSTILTYDSRSENIISSPPWKSHAELDPFKVSFGDSSIRLMDPKESEHTGRYTCVLSMPYGTHTERSDIIIGSPVGKVTDTGNYFKNDFNNLTSSTGICRRLSNVLFKLIIIFNCLF